MLLVIRRFYTASGFDNCGNEKGFVNIDATAGHTFHREVKTILTVRSDSATYVCLKDETYTDYYTV